MATISFARGIPAPDCIPVEELADCARAAIERDGATVLSYGPAAGFAPLRAWIAERHGVEPERVVVTNGSLQAFVFLLTHLVGREPGARVVVEAPTYDRPLKLLAGLGAEVVTVPVDENGLDVDALEATLADGPAPALVYTIPTFQNPSGRTLSPERRRRLVELTGRVGVPVLEDDPYGLVRFEGTPPPTLFELAGGDGVVYSSSFSKTVAPGLRVGYIVLPAGLARAVEEIAVSTTITPVLAAQATVLEFLRRGNLPGNLERVSTLLRERRDAMLDALERHFPPSASWSRPQGGYFVWLELPESVRAAELLERARREGVTFVAGSDFFPRGAGGESAARLAYSFVSPAEIEEGVARLAGLVEATVGPRGGPAVTVRA
jgi:DNA-binding transcriptional MocR family regulator